MALIKGDRKELKMWNGRWLEKGNYKHIYVAAYSKMDACRLLAQASGRNTNPRYWYHEITVYFSQAWGDPMNGITPERGVWVSEHRSGKPVRRI